MIDRILKKNLNDLRKRIREDEPITITIIGKPSQGMSSTAMINQVFDDELAKITDKNITDICKKQK